VRTPYISAATLTCNRYTADEARSLKAYGTKLTHFTSLHADTFAGELPENAKINETDTFGDQDDEGMGFEFDEDREGDSDNDVDIDEI
jgi:translation initiation factor 1A